jgi:hypothetical protein
MKQITLIILSLLVLGCTNSGVVVNFEDDKSNAIRQHFQHYLNNDMDGLKSLWSPELQVFLNSNDAISLDNLVGLLEAQHAAFSIEMQWGSKKDIGFWVETTSYPGGDAYDAVTVTQTWFNWIAKSKLTGETINLPAHISFIWDDDGKIAAEYHMYDTTQMVAAIEAAQAAAITEPK